jgi:hypothetical protein
MTMFILFSYNKGSRWLIPWNICDQIAFYETLNTCYVSIMTLAIPSKSHWPVELFRWSCQSREDQSNDVNFIFSSLRNVNVVRLKIIYLLSSVIHYSQQYLMSESTKPVWNLFDKTSFNLVWPCLQNRFESCIEWFSKVTSVKAAWTCFVIFSTSYWD